MRLVSGVLALFLGAAGFADAQPARATAIGTSRAGRIAGTVMDSTAGRALAGADVQLITFADRTLLGRRTSDSLGAFTFRDVPPGEYLVGFQHPKLDSLHLQAPVVRVMLAEGAQLELTLAIPGVRGVYAAWCVSEASGAAGGSPSGDDAIFLGHARDAGGRPLDGDATVAVSWLDLLVGRDGTIADPQERVVPVGAGGRFVVCGLPPGATLAVHVRRGTAASETVELEVPEGGLLVRDVFTTLAVDADARGGAGVVESVARTARVRGRVSTPDGVPIPRARVRVAGAPGEVRTDEAGRFTLPRASLGTSMLEVAAIGYVPRRLPIDVTTAGADSLRITLVAMRNELTAVRVTAESWRTGFAERSRRGAGTFLDEEAIRRQAPFVVADALRRVPGIRIAPTGSFSPALYLKYGRKTCTPSIFIDGRRVTVATSDLDAVLALDDLVAVEVYAQPGEVPVQFHSDAFCGAILFWRRAGRG